MVLTVELRKDNTVLSLSDERCVDTMEEIWMPVKGFEGLYAISNHGRVKSIERLVRYSSGNINRHKSVMLAPEVTKRGYLRVTLSKDNKATRYLLHRLIAFHFVDNPDNKPEINHKDHNKANNCSNNLEWVTHPENEHWNVIQRKHAPNTYKMTPDDVMELRKLKGAGWSNRDLSQKFGINERNVRRIYSYETYKNVR